MATCLVSCNQESCHTTAERLKLASMGMANIELTFDLDGASFRLIFCFVMCIMVVCNLSTIHVVA